MSFEIGDWVQIVNPNHCKFGFKGKIDAIECKIGERPKYRVGKTEGITCQVVTVEEYEIEKLPLFTINTNGYQLGKIKFEPNDFGGMNIIPINSDDAADAIQYCLENKKGEKDNMKILNIYEDRKSLEIAKKYKEEIEKVKSEDTFEGLRLNVEKQVKELYKNEYNKEFSGVILFESDCEARLLTKETKDKLAEIETNKKIELSELDGFLEEVRAQLELTEDYETQMKILKRYNIIGKDGKINA